MAVWCIERALGLFTILPAERCEQLCDTYKLEKAELDHWYAVSRKMFVPFHEDGIISQFEGYEALEELDWDAYRRKYNNIKRLDLILEDEGKTTNSYKLSKQADVLMLFYLFSTEALTRIFERLDYPFTGSMIPKNIDYYLQRTSHGSTLSAVVDAWVLARSDRLHSWSQFKEALRCDVDDEGGMTAEGVHLGAMAGSVDLLQRCYTGLELCNGELWFNPSLPAELAELSFRLRYRRHSLKVDIGEGVLTVASDSAAADPITVMMGKQKRTISPGEQARFEMQPQTAQLNT
ncbi:Trehalose 6-phosphate phosphorylase (fragment) [Beijerinckiaceae bacterium RH CH11]